MYPIVHFSTIYNSQNMEATQMSINRHLLDKEIVVHIHNGILSSVQFSHSVVSNSLRAHAACQASLSITNSQSLFKLMSIVLVMPSNHLTLCCPLLLLPSIFPNIRVFSNESALPIRWPKYWSFSFNNSPFNGILLSHNKEHC